MAIQEVGIVGAGLMGSGIAQVCAQAGLQVVMMMDTEPSALEKAMEQGTFETGDMVGLDVMMKAMMSTYEETKDMKFYPPVLMQRKVLAGHLGVKTRKGWYDYNEDGTRKA